MPRPIEQIVRESDCLIAALQQRNAEILRQIKHTDRKTRQHLLKEISK